MIPEFLLCVLATFGALYVAVLITQDHSTYWFLAVMAVVVGALLLVAAGHQRGA